MVKGTATVRYDRPAGEARVIDPDAWSEAPAQQHDPWDRDRRRPRPATTDPTNEPSERRAREIGRTELHIRARELSGLAIGNTTGNWEPYRQAMRDAATLFRLQQTTPSDPRGFNAGGYQDTDGAALIKNVRSGASPNGPRPPAPARHLGKQAW